MMAVVGARVHPDRREAAVRHASMLPVQPAFLEAIAAEALDPAYRVAADRRSNAQPRALPGTIVLLLVGGLLLGLVVGQERRAAPAAEQTRTALLGDARQRTATVTDLSNQITQLRRETSALQSTALSDTRQGRALDQQQADLTAATGESALGGPGISVSVDEAPTAGVQRGSATQRPDGTVVPGRVSDRDLQGVVNALWAAGAEAISLGGIRLSPTTAIRTAGETILADYRPLTAPYVLSVIGDPATLPDRFRTAGTKILARLRDDGDLLRVTPRPDLQLPAATGTDPRVAVPLVGAHP